MGTRLVTVGDMVIQKKILTYASDMTAHGRVFGDRQWVGVVYKIRDDSSVFLAWTPCNPPNYNDRHGYSRANIHNDRQAFDVVKK